MPTNEASLPTQLAARLASGTRRAAATLLSTDNTVRSKVLTEGGWRIAGSAVQIFYTTRNASDAAGTLKTGESAPAAAIFAAPTAGSPGAGQLVDPAQDGVKALQLPTDIGKEVEISVGRGSFVVLYMYSASAATCRLQGPFDIGRAQEIPSQ